MLYSYTSNCLDAVQKHSETNKLRYCRRLQFNFPFGDIYCWKDHLSPKWPGIVKPQLWLNCIHSYTRHKRLISGFDAVLQECNSIRRALDIGANSRQPLDWRVRTHDGLSLWQVGDCIFSRFGFTVWTNRQTLSDTHRETWMIAILMWLPLAWIMNYSK